MSVENRLGITRRKRGIAAADLARRVGVSRQTIYAMEAGDYVPNTTVALQLARELEVTVEDLFSLREASEKTGKSSTATLLSSPVSKDHPVRLARIAGKLVAVPAGPYPHFLPGADGVVTRKGRSEAHVWEFNPDESPGKRLVLAGCDPALGLLAHALERESGLEVITAHAPSRQALDWLKQGLVHVGGAHLEDRASGEFNLPYLRANLGSEDLVVVTFAAWQEGFAVASGNPKKIRSVADLARRDVRFVNREKGSGSRQLLDGLLEDAGMPPSAVKGYDVAAPGHLMAAYAVASGQADCCLAVSSAARAFDLHFVPLREERFDLVLRKELGELHSVRVLLDVLQHASLRRKLESVAGYDTARTGVVHA